MFLYCLDGDLRYCFWYPSAAETLYMSAEDMRYAGKEPATRRRGTWKASSVCKLGFFPVHRIDL
jgi:hypothetical protein